VQRLGISKQFRRAASQQYAEWGKIRVNKMQLVANLLPTRKYINIEESNKNGWRS
jgi:hypothetical protein